MPEPKAEPETGLLVLEPPQGDRFVTCVPFYELEAAAGAFRAEQPTVDPAEHHAWIRVERGRLTPDIFSIRVKGRSMEPMIRDGSYGLFRGGEALASTREGRVVLVSLRDGTDPETGGRLTVKRYASEKMFDDAGGLRHTRIVLHTVNHEFAPIVIEAAEEGVLRVIGEFVGSISEGAGGERQRASRRPT